MTVEGLREWAAAPRERGERGGLQLRELLPYQVALAREADWPLLLPAGCVEYHGEHLPLGTDTLFAEVLCDAISARLPAVVAPTVDYGPTGLALSGPDRGTLNVMGESFSAYVKEVLRNLWRMGWQRIVVLIHHQGMDGPEALSFRKAAAELTFEETLQERGPGWWGDVSPEAHPDVWNRIRVGPTILPAAAGVAGGDHAGLWESSLMCYVAPRLVALDRLGGTRLWYTDRPENPAAAATAERGRAMLEAMTEAWVNELSGAAAPAGP